MTNCGDSGNLPYLSTVFLYRNIHFQSRTQAIGVVLDLSSAVLGLTFLAWGNSIPDFIANNAMARQGYPRVGISAAYAGPTFNALIGMGLGYAVVCGQAPDGILRFDTSSLNITLALAVLLVNAATLVIVPLQSFKVRRMLGAAPLMIAYAFIIALLVLQESGLVRLDYNALRH